MKISSIIENPKLLTGKQYFLMAAEPKMHEWRQIQTLRNFWYNLYVYTKEQCRFSSMRFLNINNNILID